MISRRRVRFWALSKNSIAAQRMRLKAHAVDQMNDDRHADQRGRDEEKAGV